jgi:hypothetical protein
MIIIPVSVAVDGQVLDKCESFSHILASIQLDKATSTAKGNQNFILVSAVRCGLLIDKTAEIYTC